MLNATGFLAINASEAEKAIAEREREGWRVFRLPAAISSKTDFFKGVRDTLPLDPQLQGNRSWDALADSLLAGLDSLPESKIVIVWPEASVMQAHAREDYDIATEVLAELPDLLGDVEAAVGATKELLVICAL